MNLRKKHAPDISVKKFHKQEKALSTHSLSGSKTSQSLCNYKNVLCNQLFYRDN